MRPQNVSFYELSPLILTDKAYFSIDTLVTEAKVIQTPVQKQTFVQ